jgi:hypothetical protein
MPCSLSAAACAVSSSSSSRGVSDAGWSPARAAGSASASTASAWARASSCSPGAPCSAGRAGGSWAGSLGALRSSCRPPDCAACAQAFCSSAAGSLARNAFYTAARAVSVPPGLSPCPAGSLAVHCRRHALGARSCCPAACSSRPGCCPACRPPAGTSGRWRSTVRPAPCCSSRTRWWRSSAWSKVGGPGARRWCCADFGAHPRRPSQPPAACPAPARAWCRAGRAALPARHLGRGPASSAAAAPGKAGAPAGAAAAAAAAAGAAGHHPVRLGHALPRALPG